MARRKPTLAVWKFASCDGCQLSLLDCEDELLALAGEVEIAYFLEARAGDDAPARTTCRSSRARSRPRTTPSGSARCAGSRASSGHDRRVRHRRRHPGAAELGRRRGASSRRCTPRPSTSDAGHLDARSPTHVPVDFELRGCPIDKHQLLEVLSALLDGRRPHIRDYQRVHRVQTPRAPSASWSRSGTPCLGPVTHAGCGAICPSYDRGCYGCFGPMELAEPGLAHDEPARARPDARRCRARATRTFNGAPVPDEVSARWLTGETRTISTAMLARVEGEGGLHVELRDGKVQRGAAATSTSRRASSRRSCAGASSAKCPTSPPASAGSARWPTR